MTDHERAILDAHADYAAALRRFERAAKEHADAANMVEITLGVLRALARKPATPA